MGLFTGESICGIPHTPTPPRAARLAGGKHIYIKLTKLAHPIESTLRGCKTRKKIYGFQYMQSERRDLEYFGKGLTDEQVEGDPEESRAAGAEGRSRRRGRRKSRSK